MEPKTPFYKTKTIWIIIAIIVTLWATTTTILWIMSRDKCPFTLMPKGKKNNSNDQKIADIKMKHINLPARVITEDEIVPYIEATEEDFASPYSDVVESPITFIGFEDVSDSYYTDRHLK
jgi:hypothetical protein